MQRLNKFRALKLDALTRSFNCRNIVTKVSFANNIGQETLLIDTEKHTVSLDIGSKIYIGKHPKITEDILNSKEPIVLNPGEFKINKEFETLLYNVIKDNIKSDDIFKSRALHQYSGYLNINDERAPISYGRVADPEDIYGSVFIENGIIIPKTFEKLNTHRLYTSQGFFKLTPHLEEKLIEALSKN